MIQSPTHLQWMPVDRLPPVEEAAVTIDHLRTALEYRVWVMAGVKNGMQGADATHREVDGYIIELNLALNRLQPPQDQPPPMVELQELVQELRELRNDMQQQNAALRNEMQLQNAALRNEIQLQNAALRNDLQQQNTAMRRDLQEFRREFQQHFQRNEVLQFKLYNAASSNEHWIVVPNANGENPPEPLPSLTGLAALQQLSIQEIDDYSRFYALPEVPIDRRRRQLEMFLTHPFQR